MIEFEAWPKTPRLSNGGVTITEKIDGTNACVIIMPVEPHPDLGFDLDPQDLGGFNLVEVTREGQSDTAFVIAAQSRKRLITPTILGGGDNAGFAGWVLDNSVELVDLLGPGRHFGEWWGQGIQRRYDMSHKVFSLFNTHRWVKVANERPDWLERAKAIHLDVVPRLYEGRFSDVAIEETLHELRTNGSLAAAKFGVSFDRPEGVIIRHRDLGGNLKAFVENDDVPKSLQGE